MRELDKGTLLAVILLAVLFVGGLFFGFWYLGGASRRQQQFVQDQPPAAARATSTDAASAAPLSKCPGTLIDHTFSFSVQPDTPSYTFRFFEGAPASRDNDTPIIDCIEVYRGTKSDRPAQVLSDFYTEPYLSSNIQDNITAQDYNFDGYNDIRLVSTEGASGNISYNFWLYDPGTQQFAFSDDLSNLTSPMIDLLNDQITTHLDNGCAGACYEDDTYAFRGGALVQLGSVTQDWNGDHTMFTRTTKQLQGALMIITNVQQVPLDKAYQ